MDAKSQPRVALLNTAPLPDTPLPQWPGQLDTPARFAHAALAHSAKNPHRPAISARGKDWTYGELAAAVDAATAMLRDYGVRRGDRIMLVGENGLGLAAFILAAGLLDCCAVLENARRAQFEVNAIRAHAQPQLTLYFSEESSDAAEHGRRNDAAPVELPYIGAFMVKRELGDSTPDAIDGTSNDIAALIYTTGTTGTPKGVMLTHANLLYLGAMMIRLRKLDACDRIYGVLPITHVMGLVAVFGATLRAGAHVHLVARFSPAHCLHALETENISVLQGAPAMFSKLADQAHKRRVNAPALRFIAAGGAPIDPTVMADADALFGLPLHNGYGLTEGSGLCWTRLDAARTDCSVGLPLPGVEIRLLSPDGIPVADGEVGELWARGPNVMKGYYRNPALTAHIMRPGGWFNTQDLARVDQSGHVFIEGRTKDLIISSGFNVYPLEVENALNSHPGIVQSAVVPRNLGGNEEVIAFIERAEDFVLTAHELRQHLAERLSPYKRPREVYVVSQLPSSPNGKVLKHQLKGLAQTPDPEGVVRLL
ncbi:class I adenylate-forming enzyme family protein [Cupriavidus sp. BIC8F]|uniref:class I adenylate-forming enzyme family protein n=1 Tax=Cupriavidus sp. BIC8F TaxID=3079014 RepID=UPI0029170F82|nr:AMP-binding protein [Cupriavidus sp. BIC8F]